MKTNKTSFWLKIVGGAVAAILLALLVGKGCSGGVDLGGLLRPSGQDEVARVDTVYLVQRDTVTEYRTDTLWQREVVYLEREVPAEPQVVYLPAVEDSVNLYQGSNRDSTVDLKYRAWVKGDLVDIQLGYELLKPVTIRDTILQRFTETKTETITKELYRTGFYLGAGLSYGYSTRTLKNAVVPNFGASYLMRKGRLLNYDYAPALGTHTLSYKQRIF